jgi:hypothetical protein
MNICFSALQDYQKDLLIVNSRYSDQFTDFKRATLSLIFDDKFFRRFWLFNFALTMSKAL